MYYYYLCHHAVTAVTMLSPCTGRDEVMNTDGMDRHYINYLYKSRPVDAHIQHQTTRLAIANRDVSFRVT